MDNTNEAAPRAGMLAALRWCPFWVAALLVALVFPTELSFNIGGLRLTAYRLVLMLAFIPSVLRLISGVAGRINAIDWMVVLSVAGGYIALSYHHGLGTGIESGGIRMLEVGGSYFLARTVVVDERTFRGTTAMLFVIVTVLAPITFLESITEVPFVKMASAMMTGQSFSGPIETRHGLLRAYGPFDHPILLGVFGASIFGIAGRQALPSLGQPRAMLLPRITSVIAAASSLSAGALLALGVQLGLILWDSRTREMRFRWILLTLMIGVAYTSIDLLSNRSGLQVIFTYMTFSSQTAYYRANIFEWGMNSVASNPWLGIGFSDWVRPEWMHSTTMDNFWLVQAVTFGVPTFTAVFLACFLMLILGWNGLSPRLSRLRLGWAISLLGMLVAAVTVHFWNQLLVYLFFFLGAGAWFLNAKRNSGDAVGTGC